jgi:hypothetical protein
MAKKKPRGAALGWGSLWLVPQTPEKLSGSGSIPPGSTPLSIYHEPKRLHKSLDSESLTKQRNEHWHGYLKYLNIRARCARLDPLVRIFNIFIYAHENNNWPGL